MGNETSTSASSFPSPSSIANQYTTNRHHDNGEDKNSIQLDSNYHPHPHPHIHEISTLIQFAQSNYETKPDESLSALMHAMTLSSGSVKADEAMRSVRAELEGNNNGAAIVGQHQHLNGHSKQDTFQRVARIVQELLADQSTYLYQMGQQHIFQQAMEDGSSMVCPKCNGLVPVKRWDQHQKYWCSAVADNEETGQTDDDDDMIMMS